MSELSFLQMQEGHSKTCRALGREGLGAEVPTASRPRPSLAKVSSSANRDNSTCHGAKQHRGMGKHLKRGQSMALAEQSVCSDQPTLAAGDCGAVCSLSRDPTLATN